MFSPHNQTRRDRSQQLNDMRQMIFISRIIFTRMRIKEAKKSKNLFPTVKKYSNFHLTNLQWPTQMPDTPYSKYQLSNCMEFLEALQLSDIGGFECHP